MKLKSREITISLLIIISILTFSFSIQSVQASNFTRATSLAYSMEFISAEYLDADMDGYEDDTRFFVDVYYDPLFFDSRTIKLYCYIEIITPSGLNYNYSGFIIMESICCIIRFDVFNTISEPGWYTINFTSSFQDRGVIYSDFCTTIFDPPTGNPGGAPTISL
ncbi:MAG: hypothetical protein ACFFDW_06830 [Candidatus Thorarchaeota archaeon]